MTFYSNRVASVDMLSEGVKIESKREEPPWREKVTSGSDAADAPKTRARALGGSRALHAMSMSEHGQLEASSPSPLPPSPSQTMTAVDEEAQSNANNSSQTPPRQPNAHEPARRTVTVQEKPTDTAHEMTSSPESTAVETNFTFYANAPPPLNYSITGVHGRRRIIFIWAVLFFIEAGVLPLVLFYGIRWGTHLSITINLAIITSLIGTVSGLKMTQRTYYLWIGEGHEHRRPIGAGRWGVDCFQ
jgi:hypothetical protein